MTKLAKQILELYGAGKSYRQIAAELGCSKGTISYHVGNNQKEKTRQRTRDKRDKIKKYLQEYKQGKSCVDCREEYPYYVLEFDHCRGVKEFTIADYRNHTESLQKIVEEISKCDVVCANCHKTRTYMRSMVSPDNGIDLGLLY